MDRAVTGSSKKTLGTEFLVYISSNLISSYFSFLTSVSVFVNNCTITFFSFSFCDIPGSDCASNSLNCTSFFCHECFKVIDNKC